MERKLSITGRNLEHYSKLKHITVDNFESIIGTSLCSEPKTLLKKSCIKPLASCSYIAIVVVQ